MLKYLTILALLFVPQLSIADRVENNEKAQEMLDTARAAWAKHGLTDYSFSLYRGGVFGGVKYRVKVRDGECAKTTYWRRLFRHRASCEDRTISQLFDELESAIQADPISIWLEFDAEYGFPIEVSVEPRVDLTDQDWWYYISRFSG